MPLVGFASKLPLVLIPQTMVAASVARPGEGMSSLSRADKGLAVRRCYVARRCGVGIGCEAGGRAGAGPPLDRLARMADPSGFQPIFTNRAYKYRTSARGCVPNLPGWHPGWTGIPSPLPLKRQRVRAVRGANAIPTKYSSNGSCLRVFVRLPVPWGPGGQRLPLPPSNAATCRLPRRAPPAEPSAVAALPSSEGSDSYGLLKSKPSAAI